MGRKKEEGVEIMTSLAELRTVANIHTLKWEVLEQTGLPNEKVMSNIEYFGNTTAATLPLLLKDYESKLNPGDKLVFAAFGGGYTWGAAYLTWAY